MRVFSDFAGARRWIATGLVAGGAVLDGVGLLLIIPILDSVVTRAAGALRASRWRWRRSDCIARSPPLSALLAAFVLLAVTRALV